MAKAGGGVDRVRPLASARENISKADLPDFEQTEQPTGQGSRFDLSPRLADTGDA